MKKVLILSFFVAFFSLQAAYAQIGYVDYNVISEKYSVAKTYNATLKKKQEEIMSYAKSKDDEALKASKESEKNKIRQEGINQVKIKQKELKTLKNQYDKDLTERVKKASNRVMIQKGLDMIIKSDLVVTGGVDCTEDVLNILKSQNSLR